MSVNVVSAAAQGVSGSDLWLTAGVSVIQSLAKGIGTKSEGKIDPKKLLIVASLNAGAAKLQGVKEGKQLLLVSAINTAAVHFSPPDEGKGKANFKDFGANFAAALVGLVVAQVAQNNISGFAGQAIGAALVQITVGILQNRNSKEKSDKLSSGVLDQKQTQRVDHLIKLNKVLGAFSAGAKQGFIDNQSANAGKSYKAENAGAGFTEQQIREQGQGLNKAQKSRQSFERSVIEGVSGFASQSFDKYEPFSITKGLSLLISPISNLSSKSSSASEAPSVSAASSGSFISKLGAKIDSALNFFSSLLGLDSGSKPKTSEVDQKPDQTTVVSKDAQNANAVAGTTRNGGEFIEVDTEKELAALSKLSQQEREAALAKSGLEIDGAVLKANEKAIATLKSQGLISDKAELVGGRITFQDGTKLDVVLAFEGDKLAGALFQTAGAKEFYKFDTAKYEFDKQGKVLFAQAQIHRQGKDGQFVDTKQTISYAAQGSQQFKEAMSRAEKVITNTEALAKVKEATAIVTVQDDKGIARRVYTKELGQGNVQVNASEHRMKDGKMRMLAYDHQTKDKDGVIAKGKIFESAGEGSAYGASSVGSFQVKEVQGLTALGQQLAQGLGLAQSVTHVVYEEQVGTATREISLNKESGQLDYIHEKDANGLTRIL